MIDPRQAHRLDHLLLGVSDLDRGIAWLEDASGVRATSGGSHPGVGTRNALLSLGGGSYLEILAPDPEQEDFTFRIDVRKLPEPRLIAWAAVAEDAGALAARARAAGLEVAGPQDGARARPDGRSLHWKIVRVKTDFGNDAVDPIPFFIEWAPGSVHPSEDSPEGCELTAFGIEHPDSAAVRGVLEKLGIDAKVERGDQVRIFATLRTPKGPLALG